MSHHVGRRIVCAYRKDPAGSILLTLALTPFLLGSSSKIRARVDTSDHSDPRIEDVWMYRTPSNLRNVCLKG